MLVVGTPGFQDRVQIPAASLLLLLPFRFPPFSSDEVRGSGSSFKLYYTS